MIAFIDDNRDTYAVEPICRVLPTAPSTYHERAAQRQDPARLSARAQRDSALEPEIARVFAESFAVYGVREVWRQMMKSLVTRSNSQFRVAPDRILDRRPPICPGAALPVLR